jgi:hypothetical protein
MAFRVDPDVALWKLDEPALVGHWQEMSQVSGAVKRAVDADGRTDRPFCAYRTCESRTCPEEYREQVPTRDAAIVEHVPREPEKYADILRRLSSTRLARLLGGACTQRLESMPE